MAEKKEPKVNSQGQRELDKAAKEFDNFDQSIKDLTLDRMNMAPKEAVEPQTKMSQKDIEKSKQVYLKPMKTISSSQKFNEEYREEYNFQKEYVQFIAENKEMIGVAIEMWTRPFGGMPAEFWTIPVNTPIWAPRYVAEQLKRKYYHRLKTEDRMTGQADSIGSYTGMMVVDTTVQRLDAMPVSGRKSLFMGAAA